jgi:hypothetical protein
VTLLELMVSMTLVSLLSVGILYSIRIGLNALAQTDRRIVSNRRVTGAQRILEQQIAGFMPVAVGCHPQAESSAVANATFFEGRPATMRFVTRYSMSEGARGLPRIVEYAVIPGENGIGARLIVNEFPYTGPFSLSGACVGVQPDPVTAAPMPVFTPIEPGPNSFVLADKLDHCQFGYHFTPPAPAQDSWTPVWNHPLYPDAIRVDLGALDPDKTTLPLLPLVAPVHVTRDPTVKIND